MITQLFSQTDIVRNCLIYSTFCLCVGLVAAGLLRRSAARAHQVLLLAMAAAIVVPAMSALVSRYELGVLTAKTPPPTSSPAESTIMAEMAAPVATQLSAPEFQYEPAPPELYSPPAVSTAASTARAIPWRTILLGLWLATSLGLAARLVVTFVLGRRLLKKASAPSCGTIEHAAETAAEKLAVEKPVVVLVSDKVAGCVIWCWTRRPALLIARSAEARNNNIDWAALFAHELAHLKRLDHVSGLFAELLICIFPWQPLVWIAKKRLISFSEQACDDWAVSTADSHARYARSLLDMVPQSKPAFAPTVLPNRKHLTARIERILQGRRSNPRIGRGWALLAVVTAMLLAVTISFAQPRPAEGREIGRAEQRERKEAEKREQPRERENPEAAELRERKMHLLELQQRAKQIERELKGLNDDQDGEARELEAELRGISEQIASVKRNLEGVRVLESDLKARKSDPRFKELMQHRAELQKRAKETQIELKTHPDHPERAELVAALEEMEQQIRAIERELPGQEPKPRPVVGEREMDAHVKELMRHRKELEVRAQQIELELRELGDRHPDRSQQLREEMRAIAKETEAVERELKGAREGQEPREPDARIRELMRHRDELAERAEMMERKLKEIGDSRPDEAHELKRQLEDTLARMREVEAELRAASEGQRPGDADQPRQKLMRHRDELAQRAEMMERKLKEIGDGRPEEAHELKKQLDDTLARMREVEAELRAVSEGRRPRPGDLGNEVDRLRGEVNELRNQMGEIRQLLERLLERERPLEREQPRRTDRPRDEGGF